MRTSVLCRKTGTGNTGLELSAEYASLQALRSEQETDRQSCNQFKSELPGLESKVEKAQQAIKESAAFLETQNPCKRGRIDHPQSKGVGS